jgi:hypothetical protein
MSNVPSEAIDRMFPDETPTRADRRDEISHLARTTGVGPDPEVTCLARVAAALEALDDPVARRRVLQWAQARFCTEPSWTPTPTPKKP